MKFAYFLLLSSFSVYGQWITGFLGAQNGVVPMDRIPWSKYTHIVHFAAAPNSNGTVDLHYLLPSEIAQVVASRPAGKKLLFCLKDNDNDQGAFGAATSPGEIAGFVSNLVAFTNQYGYDGVDIDWEANINVGQYQDLIARLRNAMPDKVITMDAGNWDNLWSVAAGGAAQLDQINVMCYDMDPASNGYAFYDDALFQSGNAQLETCDWRMRPFLSAGVPASKLGIGMPYYGRRWYNVLAALMNGSFSQTTFFYRDLAVDSRRFQPQYQNYDNIHKANYLSIPDMGEFDSYVGPEHIQDAVAWQRSAGFGGFMTFTIDYEYIASRSGDASSPLSTELANQVFGGGAPAAANPAPVPSPTPTPTPISTGTAPSVLFVTPQGNVALNPYGVVTVTALTDLVGSCRYSSTAGQAFEAMTGMFADAGTLHSARLPLGPDAASYYVRCQSLGGASAQSDYSFWLSGY